MIFKLPNIDEIYKKIVNEDSPSNSVGAGNIAGVGIGLKGEPGMNANSSVVLSRAGVKEEAPTIKPKEYDHTQLKGFLGKPMNDLNKHMHDNGFLVKNGEKLNPRQKTYVHSSGAPKIVAHANFLKDYPVAHIKHHEEPNRLEPTHRYMEK